MKKKKVNILDVVFFPVFCVSFIICYMLFIIQASYAAAEYYFDKEMFVKRYGKEQRDSRSGI